MIKLERYDTFNFENALRGMRNPLDSWDKSDSMMSDGDFVIGDADMDLCKRLIKAGPEHCKFLRQIFVSVDITAPLYWWKEFDTYKVGTTANSCSTMHTIHKKEFTLDDFSHEHLSEPGIDTLGEVIEALNGCRGMFVNWDSVDDILLGEKLSSKKDAWWHMIQLLPTSYNQMRTVTLNYKNLMDMYYQRKNHKLDEWHVFVDWVKKLPYMEQFLEAADKNKGDRADD